MSDTKTNAALASFSQLQTLIESDKEIVGLVWSAVVADPESPTGLVLSEGTGGDVNLGAIAGHMLLKAQHQLSAELNSLHERIAAMEAAVVKS